jgi:hypothetical protein
LRCPSLMMIICMVCFLLSPVATRIRGLCHENQAHFIAIDTLSLLRLSRTIETF